LIIAHGLLVDDAMIAVEMMVGRLEVGDPLEKAATHVYTSTAFPMLTGTLVTVAGFIPIGLNTSNAGEFTDTLFVVIAVSLLVSWIVAVLFTPLLGVTILPARMKGHHESKGRLGQTFARLLLVCMRHRRIPFLRGYSPRGSFKESARLLSANQSNDLDAGVNSAQTAAVPYRSLREGTLRLSRGFGCYPSSVENRGRS
jgi:hypothetical protein